MILWRHRLLLFVRLSAVFAIILLSNHKCQLSYKHSSSMLRCVSWGASFSYIAKRCNPNFVKITEMSSYYYVI